jgi:hypothetical protein
MLLYSSSYSDEENDAQIRRGRITYRKAQHVRAQIKITVVFICGKSVFQDIS